MKRLIGPLVATLLLAALPILTPAASAQGATCNGQRVTVDLSRNGGNGNGTNGRDVILGTSGADTINGFGGDDVICAGGGNDTVQGGSGNDFIFGNAGDDKLFGAQGADTIYGGNGNDTIHGNRGNDTLHGESGIDRIFGYGDDDLIYGGAGDDRLHGNFGDDTILGEDGNDTIHGYGDDDTLHGGPGNDRMHGNFGDDTILGDAGNDVIFGYGDDDTLYGGTGDDWLQGNFGDDRITGGPGRDTLSGSAGADVLSGGADNDVVQGDSGNDVMRGNSGNDTLDGGIDFDICVGNDGSDSASRCESSNDSGAPTIPSSPAPPSAGTPSAPAPSAPAPASTPVPSNPGPTGQGPTGFTGRSPIYFNDFSNANDANRIHSFVHYRDDSLVAHTTGRSDHAAGAGVACSAPEQTRPQTRERPQDHVYLCHPGGNAGAGHMMGYAMDTSGYGFVGGLPDQVFQGMEQVSVDINTTNAGSRNFVEIKVLPASRTFVDGMPCGWPLPCNDGWDYDDIGGVGAATSSNGGVGMFIMTPAEPDGYRFDGYNTTTLSNGDVQYEPCGADYCHQVDIHEGNTDIRTRYRHTLRDNGNGTLSFGVVEGGNTKWVTAPGSFPDGPLRVVITFHNYTGTKSGQGPGFDGNVSPSTGGFTWHWDNLAVIADTAVASRSYYGGLSAEHIVVPDGCIAFSQGPRGTNRSDNIAPEFAC